MKARIYSDAKGPPASIMQAVKEVIDRAIPSDSRRGAEDKVRLLALFRAVWEVGMATAGSPAVSPID